ncbi:regulator of nucleoside diphosphate kinase [Lutimaribacter pacificus]|uniref:Regulator of nucleoside diphosphate kinase n=1 Tax=Lutimaribacter pacificus TaxID=391948 RepID=A0A1H0D1K3_9RHOB|nr:nucleoside diphosphate kinase regulator [Lutimaribacter pacificus]SDN64067.1 regulator of nucleoside diphosphate kinase [Lutimaribacter pacificus]SHJ38026.1 regulator of nucleoside diphosphate kinase [Lutimaribacter pacificus]
MAHPYPRRTRAARPVIAEAQLATLEDLATGFARRSPDLSDRLLSRLARARIAPPRKMPADVVTLGVPATCLDEETGETRVLTLVPPAQADIASGAISVMTPIGVAMIGLPVGAQVRWQTRDGASRSLLLLGIGETAGVLP